MTTAPITRAGQKGPSPEVVTRVARATLRRHAASPLTGLLSFWERVASTVLAELAARSYAGVPSPEDVADVARATAPAFSGSPLTLSDRLWESVVSTVVTEYLAPSGMGEPIPVARNPRTAR